MRNLIVRLVMLIICLIAFIFAIIGEIKVNAAQHEPDEPFETIYITGEDDWQEGVKEC